MKKILALLLLTCMLAAYFLAVPAWAAGETVVYLDGVNGNDTNTGTSADAAVKTLAKAYGLLGDADGNGMPDGGTIVLSGDLTVYATHAGTTSDFPQTDGKVLITGKDATAAYQSVITVSDAETTESSPKGYLAFLSEIEFSYITFDRNTKNSLQFITGPSLTFAEGVVFTHNGELLTDTEKDNIVVRLGSHSGKISAEYTQKSGTLSSVYGGNEKYAVDDASDTSKSYSRINLSGTAKILVRLEGGANQKYLRNSEINISSDAEVSTLFLGGYKANVGKSTVTITGGTVGAVVSCRSNDSATEYTVGDTAISIGGTAVVGSVTLNQRNSGGNNTLTISNDQTLTGNFGAYWDSITVSSGATVDLVAAYDGTGTLAVDGVLILDSAANEGDLPTNSGSGVIRKSGEDVTGLTVVYLDGVNGLDTNDGTSAATAVKTLEQAYLLLSDEGGTIYLSGHTEITATNGSTTPFSVKSGAVHITGVTGSEKLIITGAKGTATVVIQSATELSNLNLDWNCSGTVGLYIFSGPSLTFGENMVFTKQDVLIADLSDGAAKDYISVRVGAYSDSACTDAVFTQRSGALSSIYAGNDQIPLNSSTINVSGDAQVLIRLQGGATKGNVGNVTVNVSGNADVAQLTIGGHTKDYHITKSDINITGGTVHSIIGARSAGFKVGDVDMTVSGSAKIGDIEWQNGDKTGSSYTLTFEKGLESDLVFQSLGDFWTAITMGESVKLHLDAKYDLVDGVLTVENDGILYISSEDNTSAPVKGVNYTGNGTGIVLLDTHSHALKHKDVVCSAGDAPGNIAHWYCDDTSCSGYGNCYLDEAGTQPVSKVDTVTYGGHKLVHASAKCDEMDEVIYYVCEYCGLYFSDAEGKNEVTRAEIDANTDHKGVFVDVKAPTCTVDGVRYAHWNCENCNWNFKDEACTQVYTYSVVEPKLGHKNMTLVEAKDATCSEDGNTKHYYCPDCDGYYNAGTVRVPIDGTKTVVKADHAVKHVDAKTATCEENGNIEYWYCDTEGCGNCGKYFADAACTQEITLADTVTVGHQLTEVPAVAPTCEENGNVAYYLCQLCGKTYADKDAKTELTSVTEEALGHNLTRVEEVPATPSKTGVKEHWVCAECGKLFADAKGENEITDPDSLVIPKVTSVADTGEAFQVLPVVMLMLLSAAGVAFTAAAKKRGRV